MKNKISAVIITFNEERNIGRCIDSLEGIADEIIVVDSLSTDSTAEIVTSKGATLVKHAFEGYIEQKNFAITCATFEYALSLDADEAISETLKQSLLEAKNDLKFDVYQFNRLTNFCGQWIKHCGWYPDVKKRLFKKSIGKWGGKNPHDKFIANSNAKVKHISGDLLHYSFYTTDEHLNTISKFTDIAARAYFEKGIKSNVLKLIINPVSKFMRNYVFKLGFLDGYYGWLICTRTAHATYLKYAKLKKIQESERA